MTMEIGKNKFCYAMSDTNDESLRQLVLRLKFTLLHQIKGICPWDITLKDLKLFNK